MRAADLLTQLARPGNHRRLLIIEGQALPAAIEQALLRRRGRLSLSWQYTR